LQEKIEFDVFVICKMASTAAKGRMTIRRPVVARIDLSAVRHNYRLAQSLAPGAQTMPMVKANAYGHGAVEVAHALKDIVPAFGCACIEEALALRDAGITNPVLLLEGTFGSAEEVEVAAQNNFWLMVENHAQVDAILEASPVTALPCWMKIDTGMHRLGLPPEEALGVYNRLKASSNVNETIIVATHFASAEDLGNSFTAGQLSLFNKTIDTLKRKLAASSAANGKNHKLLFSLANSAAVLAHPQTHRDWNRPGYMIYGYSPIPGNPQKYPLKPVMKQV